MSMRRTGLCGLSVLAPFALFSAAGAQEAPVKSLPKVQVSTEEEPGYSAARSTATKTDTPLRDVPQAISVITRQAIEDQSAQNLGDVVRYVPGVGVAQGEGNRETPVFRGNASTADFFIDGMRDDVQYYRDLYNIEQVEVLRGPNGMIFGRGGTGGVINRVTKVARFAPVRELSLQAGTFGNKRGALDIGQGLNEAVAFRVNGMYEDSDSYRDDVMLKRYGVNPTVTWQLGDATSLVGGVEYFHDERIADRGISSFQGRPVDTHASTFFGDPAQSPTHATVRSASVMLEHRFSESMVVRNRTRYAEYSKFYQNVFPGAVDTAGTIVSISAYNNATDRNNLFNQTDLNFTLQAGSIRHDVLAGLELGRQQTNNFRMTGFFDSVAVGRTSIDVPLSNPRTTLPVTFRQNATDADNDGTAKVAAVYVQDQIAFGSQLIATLGVRYDQFKVDFSNHRTATRFSSDDGLLSPRVGLVYKPVQPLSLYASYSMTYQPRAGEQLSSLSLTNQSLDPEEFRNQEIGAKWEVGPSLLIDLALYRLERTNVAITDPNNPNLSLLIDGQRVRGAELGITGHFTDAWSVIAAAAYQDGEILSNQSATVQRGARLASLPKSTFSFWSRYDLDAAWGVGLGIVNRAKMFAATENLVTPASNVTLGSYTRVDAALFFRMNERLRAQANLENLFGKDYFVFANSNTNITPGSPRALRASLVYAF